MSQDFKEELKAIRRRLQAYKLEDQAAVVRLDGAGLPALVSRRRLHDAFVPEAAQVARPQATRMLIDVAARSRRTRSDQPGATGGFVKAAKWISPLLLAIGVIYGPPYYKCRQMKEQGLFWYGTTVGSCVRDRMSERSAAIQDLAQRTFRPRERSS